MCDAAAVEPADARSHIPVMSTNPEPRSEAPAEQPAGKPAPSTPKPKEIGGPKGPEPTRYGDWEVGGRCTDF
jgi:hypothetical protein